MKTMYFGTAETESILRRFMSSASLKGFSGTWEDDKTIFLFRFENFPRKGANLINFGKLKDLKNLNQKTKRRKL